MAKVRKQRRERYTSDSGVDFIYKKDLSGFITIQLNESNFDVPVEALVEFIEWYYQIKLGQKN